MGNYAPTYFLAATAEVDFLRMVWYSAYVKYQPLRFDGHSIRVTPV